MTWQTMAWHTGRWARLTICWVLFIPFLPFAAIAFGLGIAIERLWPERRAA